MSCLIIKAKEIEVTGLESEIRQLELDVSNAEAAAAAARAAGKRHLNKAGGIRRILDRKRNDLVNLKTEIARMQSTL